jgi:acyl-CoA hydrolase
MHLVKSEDLNHHGTLYAGRTAEWFVEAGFIAASSTSSPENTLCKNIHGMVFNRPVRKGQVVSFKSRIVKVGRTSIVTLVEVWVGDQMAVRGFITFIHVDLTGKPQPHGLVLVPTTDEEKALYEEASKLV